MHDAVEYGLRCGLLVLGRCACALAKGDPDAGGQAEGAHDADGSSCSMPLGLPALHEALSPIH